MNRLITDPFAADGVSTLDIYTGTAGDDLLRGRDTNDTFHLEDGGEDTAKGGDGHDVFYMGGALDAGDRIDGGRGSGGPLFDEVVLDGDYSFGLVLKDKTLTGIEELTLTAGNDYDLTLNARPATKGGPGFLVDGSTLGTGDHLTLDASRLDQIANIAGGAAADHIVTGAAGAQVFTHGGADTVLGGTGRDAIHGDAESAILSGGDGDDSIILSALGGQTLIDGAAGSDVLALAGGTAAAPAVLAAGQVSGFENIQVLSGYVEMQDGVAAGIDQVRVYGGNVGFTFDASAVSGTSFNMSGGQGDDVLRGGAEGDLILGYQGDNSLIGNGGDDVIQGAKGHDKIAGGSGADLLTGRDGADQFVYLSVEDSTQASHDRITDLTASDQIVLKPIDADDKKAGDQAFHLVEAFSGHRGELVLSYDHDSDLTTISGDVNGDGAADLVITANGNHADFTNFVL